MRHVYFCDNSGKYSPIFVIFSLLYTTMNCGLITCLYGPQCIHAGLAGYGYHWDMGDWV